MRSADILVKWSGDDGDGLHGLRCSMGRGPTADVPRREAERRYQRPLVGLMRAGGVIAVIRRVGASWSTRGGKVVIGGTCAESVSANDGAFSAVSGDAWARRRREEHGTWGTPPANEQRHLGAVAVH